MCFKWGKILPRLKYTRNYFMISPGDSLMHRTKIISNKVKLVDSLVKNATDNFNIWIVY